MTEEWLERLLASDEAKTAYLGAGDGIGVPWMHATVDMLRAYVRQGGDVLDGLGRILARVHSEKTQAFRDEVDRYNNRVSR